MCGLKPKFDENGEEVESVTPFVGVWIETIITSDAEKARVSHPSWVCGLKL